MIHEFNCLREDPNKEGEYIFFGVEIPPTNNLSRAIERAKSQIKEDQWDEQIWISGYWIKGKCDDSGSEYNLLSKGWITAN